jgi:hypothetical protein
MIQNETGKIKMLISHKLHILSFIQLNVFIKYRLVYN